MIEAIIELLAGLGVLLVGFKLLSDNIEKLATGGLKKMFNKTSGNRFVGVGIGAAATALIQSSSATTVMIVGFVNAGIMNLFQATAMIMGANIGTTITAQIAALGSLDISLYATLLAVIGIFMQMLCKKDKTKTIGLALAGLGIVFVALGIMSGAMKDFASDGTIPAILESVTNPVVLLVLGAVLTAVIQSSSAMTTIVISMVAAGMTIGNGGNSILYVILGTNIGTCITAILSSIGATTNAKRASLIHLMFNFFGSIIYFAILLFIPKFMESTFASWFALPSTQIAMFHTFFNVTSTLVFLPFINLFVKASQLIIRDKKKPAVATFIDDRFLNAPSIALAQAGKETLRLGKMSIDALALSIDSFLDKNYDNYEDVKKEIGVIEELNQHLLSYLIKVASSEISDENEKVISKLHSMINDFYREAEIADNMMKYTKSAVDNNLRFSDKVCEQIKQLKEKLIKQYDLVNELYLNKDVNLLIEIDNLEDEIDDMRSIMTEQHIERLENNECSPASSGVFINLVSNLERAGDHLSYIAHTIVE